jgi:hypothetical protein
MLKSVKLQVTVPETADEVGLFDITYKKSSWHWGASS